MDQGDIHSQGPLVYLIVDMDTEKNAPERFEKAFEDVPRDVWHVFEDPKELYARIDKLKEAGF